MSKKNRMVWRDVLSSVPELPPCPSDMGEPLYAALVFGQHCFGCGASDASWVDYALHLRMCERCYKANVVVGTHVFKSVPQHFRNMIRDVALMLVPSANTFEFFGPTPSFDPVNPLTHDIEDFYFKPELEAMFRLFWPLPAAEDIAALRPLVRTRVNYVMTRQAYAVLLHVWDNYCFEPTVGEESFIEPRSKGPPLVLSGDARSLFDADRVLADGQFIQGFVVGRILTHELCMMRSLAAELEGGCERRATGPWILDWPADLKDVLVRPTALFMCRECGAQPYAFPEINVHWQEAHPDKTVWTDACKGLGGEGEYGAEVWEEGAEVVEKILAVLVEKGLREDERDMGSLDKLIEEGRVFCACGDPTMATPGSMEEELSWETLVDHVFSHLNDNTLRRNTSLPSNDTPVWLDDHDPASCIKYLPEDADTSEANNRVVADEATRERIDALLRQCPKTSSPACRLCDALTPDNRKDDSLFLTASADGIVYHMRAKHGKNLEEEDVVFWDKSGFDKP
ncbi:hypothetical protein V8D89_006226 [Ganoderma adspersum]